MTYRKEKVHRRSASSLVQIYRVWWSCIRGASFYAILKWKIKQKTCQNSQVPAKIFAQLSPGTKYLLMKASRVMNIHTTQTHTQLMGFSNWDHAARTCANSNPQQELHKCQGRIHQMVPNLSSFHFLFLPYQSNFLGYTLLNLLSIWTYTQ